MKTMLMCVTVAVVLSIAACANKTALTDQSTAASAGATTTAPVAKMGHHDYKGEAH